ncbi:WxL domain-containing protein [Carnobacterium maltaromaticum]|uniref:WxL domain-containing protein n=1 Tax=Carnobacterium maltaromaticum TaxID=2751 RepID=UPI0039BDA724
MKTLVKISLVSAFILSLGVESLVAHAADTPYVSNGILDMIPGTGGTPPLYPVDPDANNPVEPIEPTPPNSGTAGPLSLDYASIWDFGKQKISTKDEVYYAKLIPLKDGRSVAPYVQVSDFRGTNSGWSLFVRQEEQFENEELTNSELTGAELHFGSGGDVSGTQSNIDYASNVPYSRNGPLVPGGGNVNVFLASEGAGSMTWLRSFGDNYGGGQTPSTAVRLSIPGQTPKDAGQYKTTLTWTLSDVPAPPRPVLPDAPEPLN